MLYFDCNATVPLHPAARRAWLDVTDRVWHNPSSLYAAATVARDLLDDCRERLADLLVCDPARIIFTAGATAAVNMLARHLGRSAPAHGGAVISAIEHPCVRESFLSAMPGQIREIPVNGQGVVALEAVADLLNAAPLPPEVVSVMAASNEVGTIQPWRDVALLCHARNIAFHTDAAQWLGKLPARGLGDCDWVSGSGHKYGGPKGVGFLVVPIDGSAFWGDRGGPQEDGRHAGTEDVAAIAAMLAALEAREQEIATGIHTRAAARDAAERHLQERLPVAVIVGQQTERLWNTSALIIPGADGRKLVSRLERAGVAASTGSACSAGSDSTSRITTAIGADALGITATDLRGMVRLSAGWDTPAAAWMKAADAIVEAVRGDGEHLPRVSLTEMR